jgi:hypothetical protein
LNSAVYSCFGIFILVVSTVTAILGHRWKTKFRGKLNAAAVVFFHCHPSGVAEPSSADEASTRRLREALGLVDVRVRDHVVVTSQECVSFAEK